MASPHVSVVMPAFNAGRFIDEAIKSVRCQSLATWELIIVNDGSTDDTGDIAEKHAAQDGRIRVIHQTNAGQAAANNRAIPEARAKYIARMDADDVSMPERLMVLSTFLDENPDILIVGTDAVLCSPCGDTLERTHLPESDNAIRFALFTRRMNAFYNPTLMFRKSAWLKSGGERSCFGHAHDLDLCLRIVERGAARNLPRPTIRYRVHSGQVSTTATELQATCALAAFLCADNRRRGHNEPTYVVNTDLIGSETLKAAGVSAREIDEAVISNIVGIHGRLCMLGGLAEAQSLRKNTAASYAGTPAKARLAAAQCVMLYHEGKCSRTLTRRLAAWGAGVRHLPAGLPWLQSRLRNSCYRRFQSRPAGLRLST